MKKTGTIGFMETLKASIENVLPRHFKRLSEFIVQNRDVQLTLSVLFEGLAGSSANIDTVGLRTLVLIFLFSSLIYQIFEIDAEFESALDTDEGIDQQHHFPRRPRTMSQNIALRHVPSNGHAAPLPKSPSLLHRGSDAGHSCVSPLAQAFNPFIGDDIIPEETSDNSPHSPSGPVSYGPVTRRRLYSMHSSRGLYPSSPVKHSPLRKYPTMPDSSPTIPQSQPLSSGPDDVHAPSGGDQSQGEPSSGTAQPPQSELTTMDAGALEMENRMDSQTSIWTKRLTEIEKRQERIEDLLSQIVKEMRQ